MSTKASPRPQRGSTPSADDVRNRITRLTLFRVILVTLVFGVTLVLHRTSPQDLTQPGNVVLLGIIAATYALTALWAVLLRRVRDPLRFGDIQTAADLVVTSTIVHLTGGAQSGYTFLFPVSIIGFALLRHRRGVTVVGVASILLYVGVALAGWLQLLPIPDGLQPLPWEPSGIELVRQLVLNSAAFAAVAVLSSFLSQQLAKEGERLETQRTRTADQAALTQDIVRCLSSGLITVDRESTVMTVNEAAADILGVARSSPPGRPISDLVPALAAKLDALAPDGVIRRLIVPASRGAHELSLGVSVTPLTNHRSQAIGRVINLQDLTELRAMEEQVARSQRLASIGQLAAGIAHEIRNPLAAISGSIEMLRQTSQVDADNRALMDIVLREVDRLNGMVTDLLAFARPRPSEPESIELRSMVAETIAVFSQDRAYPGVTVRLVEPSPPAAEPIEALADPAQLRQVLWNLLRNAADAMPDGGELTVAPRNVAAEDGSASVELVVADTGVGIPPEDLERIFDPFYSTKATGTGLGLATVHRIVTDHHGTLAVTSTQGEGTRFTIRLPRSGPTPGSTP